MCVGIKSCPDFLRNCICGGIVYRSPPFGAIVWFVSLATSSVRFAGSGLCARDSCKIERAERRVMSKKIGHRGQLHAVRAASEARNNARNKAVPFQPTSRKLRGRGTMTRHTTINQRESRSWGGMRIAGCTHGGRGGTYARVGTWRPHSSPAAPSTVNESPLSTECSPSRPATRAFGFLRGKSRAKTRTNKAPRLLVPGLGLNGCRPEGPASRGGQGRREARRRQAPRAPRHRDATRAPTLR